ncbi:MAG: FAD-dependent oxidoreductase [Methanosarcinaceae archaeon]|nr:FAD-dependent oxidoreductase [Methanosarcinaceae archaeon]
MGVNSEESKKKLVIIGGGAVGMAVATHTHRCGGYSITVLSKDSHTAYSQCGIPFVLGGEIKDFNSLLIRSIEYFEQMGIRTRLNTVVDDIDLDTKTIGCSGKRVHFDKLVIATGSVPYVPESIEFDRSLGNVFTLRTLTDGVKIDDAFKSAKNLVIIGAGSIGVEVALGAVKRGISTTLVNRGHFILSHNIDPDMSEIVRMYLESKGLNLITGSIPESITGSGNVESVTIGGNHIPADVVIISTGVKPETSLANSAGITIGSTGGIVVNENLNVSINDDFHPDVYAGGECVEVHAFVTGEPMLNQLGSEARRMAARITDNLCGTLSTMPFLVNPWVCIAGGLQIGSVGLTSQVALKSGIKVITGMSKGETRAGYYPGGSHIFIKLLFRERHLIGAQVIAGEGVKERIDCLSFAIKKRLTIDDLLNMETCYAPPVSMLVDPLRYAAEDALKKMQQE